MANPNHNKKPIQHHALTFPPFPASPPDLISFKDFQEVGIHLYADDDEDRDTEKDNLGIQTIPLKKRHDTDVCKSNTRRKTDTELADEVLEAWGEKTSGSSAKDGKKTRPWWEEWAHQERSKGSFAVDP
jgi:hypothetical protein